MRKNNPFQIFVLIFLVFALASFFILSGREKTFRSETDILIIAKSPAASENVDQIIENAKNIPFSLSFYDRLSQNSFEANQNGLSNYARKKNWLSKIEIARAGGSGILKITAKDVDQQTAENLSLKVSQDLIVVLSKYYNLKEAIDVRIIDGPISFYDNLSNWPKNALYSMIIGIVSSGLFTYLLYLATFFDYPKTSKIRPVASESFFDFGKSLEKTKEVLDFSARLPKISDWKISEKKPEEVEKKFRKEIAQSVQEKKTAVVSEIKSEPKKETPTSFSKGAVAPGNLPIADMSMFKFATDSDKKEIEKDMETPGAISAVEEPKADLSVEIPQTHEPTPEEVKERLNRLLRGEI